MTKLKCFHLLLGCIAIFLSQNCFSMTLEISWRWHRPATELYGPVFHPLSKDIAIVAKAHWPDFHDAESYPDSFFSSLEKRKESEPRFADPTIVLLEDRGKSERTIDWGWEPAFSPDGHLFAYAFRGFGVRANFHLTLPVLATLYNSRRRQMVDEALGALRRLGKFL